MHKLKIIKLINLIFSLILLSVSAFLIYDYLGSSKRIPVIIVSNIDSGTIENVNICTGNLIFSGNTITGNNKIEFQINKDCTYTGEEYKYIDVFDKNVFTTKKPNYLLYTKPISVEGKIEEAYICIISNVRSDYKKRNAYYFSTYIYFGDEDNAGHIHTAFNPNNFLVYDNSTDKTFPYNGKFYGHEAPFGYILNLNKLVVSDKEIGGYKYIYPLKLLNKNNSLRIGGFVNGDPNYWAGYIQKYRIIYKGGSLSVKK